MMIHMIRIDWLMNDRKKRRIAKRGSLQTMMTHRLEWINKRINKSVSDISCSQCSKRDRFFEWRRKKRMKEEQEDDDEEVYDEYDEQEKQESITMHSHDDVSSRYLSLSQHCAWMHSVAVCCCYVGEMKFPIVTQIHLVKSNGAKHREGVRRRLSQKAGEATSCSMTP